MTSGQRALALVAVWVSVGGAIAVVASASFMTHQATTIALSSILAVAGVAATWLITRSRPTDD
jgi:hypothetical protein